MKFFAFRAPHGLKAVIIHDAAFIENLNQAFHQRMVCVRGFGLSQKKFEPVFQPFRQPRKCVFQHREPLEQVLFVGSCFGNLDPR